MGCLRWGPPAAWNPRRPPRAPPPPPPEGGWRCCWPAPRARAPPIPQLAPAIATVVHERLELGVRHRRRGDAEGREVHRMRPLLVVEDEALVRRCAEQERAPGHRDVTRPVARIDRRRRRRRIRAAEAP